MSPRQAGWLRLVVGLVVVGAATLAAGVWYFVFRDSAPPAVSHEAATRALADAGTAATTADTSGSSAASGSATLTGNWKVDTTIGSFHDYSSSWAGYRVKEELAGIGAKTAVGRTPRVSGTMTIDGTTTTATSVQIDMTTLTSDESQRDSQLRMQAIETQRFPTATFKLTAPISLGSVPAPGEKVSIKATGDLTLHGVTRPVVFPLEASRTGDVIVVTGSLDVKFADHNINKPTSFKVLSVENHGLIELQLFYTRS